MFAAPIGVRDRAEVDAQINAGLEASDAGRSAYPGKSYEEGVRDALAWALGDEEEPPLPIAD